jgi:hypothetical protein
MKTSNNKINFYFIILLTILIVYLFNILVFHINFDELIGVKGLLVNYDGGFIRRGLLGEIITSLSLNFSFPIKNIFTLLHLINYILFFFFNYYLFKKFKKNFLFYFFIFSPIYLFYPLVAITTKYAEHIIQREAYILTIFLSLVILGLNFKNRNLVLVLSLITIIFSTFLYELTILCYPFFFTIYYIFLKKNNFLINYFEILIALFLCSLLIIFHLLFYGENNLTLMINNLNSNFGFNYKSSDLLYSWLNKDISKQIIFFIDGFKLNYILKYLFYSHPIILLIIINHNFIKDKIYLFLFNISIISFSVVFAIATDWARFVHILYSLCLITFAFYFYSEKKDIFANKGNSVLMKLRINHKIANLMVFIYCIIWNLKHTYWQNHLSYAFFKIIKQNVLYFNELIF